MINDLRQGPYSDIGRFDSSKRLAPEFGHKAKRPWRPSINICQSSELFTIVNVYLYVFTATLSSILLIEWPLESTELS